MGMKIKLLLFYAVIIDGYVYYFGKDNRLAPFYGLLIAAITFIPGVMVVRKIKSYFDKRERS